EHRVFKKLQIYPLFSILCTFLEKVPKIRLGHSVGNAYTSLPIRTQTPSGQTVGSAVRQFGSRFDKPNGKADQRPEVSFGFTFFIPPCPS
ncbi:MAG: hypothetical protein K9N46_15985, partial [Candidatus Marinimicrobia bacterium]|nr:hypothetical protein [Candidatus Neomarinimicrobiota bacterium]MCF7830153.1 hypothetical protein [Candidatus Neomarinimicrobiota bacterium]MCF7882230.1 hypothetical protein [Candidatus Neomarinimicrobiota bacterium]